MSYSHPTNSIHPTRRLMKLRGYIYSSCNKFPSINNEGESLRRTAACRRGTPIVFIQMRALGVGGLSGYGSSATPSRTIATQRTTAPT